MTKAMPVPLNGTPREININGLHDLQAAVGGTVSVAYDIFDDDDDIVVYINDNGKFTCQPNRAVFAQHDDDANGSDRTKQGDLIDILFGDFVCIGDGRDGEDTDLTDKQIEIIKKRFDESTINSGAEAAFEIVFGASPTESSFHGLR